MIAPDDLHEYSIHNRVVKIIRASKSVVTTVPGTLLIVDGPSAVGKSSIVRALLDQNNVPLSLARRVTTRLRRAVEDDEDVYDFISHEEFEMLAEAKALAEFKCYKFGMCYGLPVIEVLPKLHAGQHVVAMINLGNIEKVRAVVDSVFGVFVTASLPTIEERLRRRLTHTQEQIDERLENALQSRKYVHLYDLVVASENRSVREIANEIVLRFAEFANAPERRASRL